MVEIKNNGSKAVHVGKNVLLPGATMKIADKLVETPAIQVLAKLDVLEVVATVETPEAAVREAEKVAEETTSAKKSSSKKATTVSETE